MFQKGLFYSVMLCLLLIAHNIQAQKVSEITVKVNQRVNAVPASMWGIFFEDINFAADGGIYAELVKNRSFSFNWWYLCRTGEKPLL